MNTYTIKIYIFLCIWLMCTPAFSQDLPCGTITDSKSVDMHFELRANSSLSGLRSSSAEIYRYGIKHHIIRNTNGTGGLSPSVIYKIVNELNDEYLSGGIQFYTYGSIHYIDNSSFMEFVRENHEATLINSYNDPNAINVYYFPSVKTSGESAAGYSYIPTNTFRKNFTAIGNSYAGNGTTVIHEIGHFMGLFHTHQVTNNIKEHPNGSNCSTAGDLCCDTPADPNLSGKVNTNCVYTGGESLGGVPYRPDVHNLMSYSRKECRTRFSNQQYQMMFNTSRTVRLPYSGDFVLDYELTINSYQALNFTNFRIVNGGHLIVNGNGSLSTTNLIIDGGGKLTINYGKVFYGKLTSAINSEINVASGNFVVFQSVN